MVRTACLEVRMAGGGELLDGEDGLMMRSFCHLYVRTIL